MLASTHRGDCREVIAERIQPETFHACVTDPPYALGSLAGVEWDTQIAFDPDTWRLVRDTLKPGGWLLAFAHPRTYHRIAYAVDMAGFEVHDMLAWVYSSGMPRGQSQAKRIAQAGGDPKQWEGWSTTLKPAMEPILLARRPRQGTAAENAVRHETGLLNIDGCRVGDEERYNPPASNKAASGGPYLASTYGMPEDAEGKTVQGRWPANVVIDDVVAELDPRMAKYFYVSKPSATERAEADKHPTLKPVELMRYLVRLVARPGSHILDPFSGSGTTGVAAIREGMQFTGIEQSQADANVMDRRVQGALLEMMGYQRGADHD